MEAATRRNIFTFGLGTVGRDMVYAMVSMYLIFYLTDILTVSAPPYGGSTALFCSAGSSMPSMIPLWV